VTQKTKSTLRRFSLANLKTKQKVISVAFFPLSLIVVIGSLIVFNLSNMQSSAQKVADTQVVLSEARAIFSAATDMETGLRGYLLTGREGFLDPYTSGQITAYQTLADLRETVKDTPLQVARLDEAEQFLRDWQAKVAEGAIKLRREINRSLTMNDMASEVGQARGKVYFDQFRAEIANFIEVEETLLAARNTQFFTMIDGAFATPDAIRDGVNWVEHTYGVINSAKDILAAAVDMETGMHEFLLTGDPAVLEPYTSGFARIESLVGDLSKTVGDNPEQVARITAAANIIAEWQADVVEPTLEMRRDIDFAATMADMENLVGRGRGKKSVDAFRAVIADFQAEEQAVMDERQAANKFLLDVSKNLIPGAIAAALLIGGTLAWYIGTSISKSVKAITASMRGLADGNDAVEINGQERGDEVGEMARALDIFRDALVEMKELEKQKAEGRDADLAAMVAKLSSRLSALSQGKLDVQIQEGFPEGYEQLREDFNKTCSTFQEIVEQVVETSNSMRSGADEISQASDDLSQRTESQAATLEETAAALDELTASVSSAAEGARRVETTMGEAGSEAERSGEVVQSAVAAMTEIEESSRHISQIISVIDDIAFQTNLLSLNAGVEAARAGEAGRGFAVVASEVRALAQRSADAALEIKTLIGDSSRQVERGVALVANGGTALQSIVGQVGHITTLVSDMAEGAAEQSVGLNEINTGMTQLDQVTQQNAAMVEEVTAAGHLLKSDASKLTSLMAHFDISGGGHAAPAEVAPSAHGGDQDADWSMDAAPAPMAATGTEGRANWEDF